MRNRVDEIQMEQTAETRHKRACVDKNRRMMRNVAAKEVYNGYCHTSNREV